MSSRNLPPQPQAAAHPPASFRHELALERETVRYAVHVGAQLAELRRSFAGDPGRAVLVTDTNVARHGHAERVAAELGLVEARCFVVPAGEAHKTPQTLLELVQRALDAGLERGGTWFALGGGVVGDLTGLAAALYMRGGPVVQLPTSLLAMVDAAIGGKTGVDLPAGKNLLGCFHHPRAVIADVAHLQTLPVAELRHGLAEMLKHGWIADAGLLAELEALPSAAVFKDASHTAKTAELVQRAVAVKVAVVQADETERGQRMLLNFGHTIGHALEAATDYATPHGAAVAIGMLAETQIACNLGIAGDAQDVERLRAMLERFGLPTTAAARWIEPTLAALRHDKKRHAGHIRMALPVNPGKATVVEQVETDTIASTLRTLWTHNDG